MQNKEQKFIYHYTSLENVMSIIQREGLVFWGSRYDCMNDPFDSIYPKNILVKELESHGFEKGNNKGFPDYIPYIVSFSKNRDDALMWRLYNAQVCLKLYRKRIENKCNFNSSNMEECRDCSYMYKKQIIQNINEILDGRNKSKEDVWEKVCKESVFIKHPDFKCEGEVRAVKFNMRRDPKDKIDDIHDYMGKIKKDFKYKKVLYTTKIAYYKEFYFDKDTLGGIIVRANDDSEFNDIKEHLEMWLYKHGGYNVSPNFIQKSKRVPVR